MAVNIKHITLNIHDVPMLNPQCAKCVERFCYRKEYDPEQLPHFCPMKHKQDVIDTAMMKYDAEETRLYVNSTVNEQRAY